MNKETIESIGRDVAIRIFKDLCNYSTFDGINGKLYIDVSDYLTIRMKYIGVSDKWVSKNY